MCSQALRSPACLASCASLSGPGQAGSLRWERTAGRRRGEAWAAAHISWLPSKALLSHLQPVLGLEIAERSPVGDGRLPCSGPWPWPLRGPARLSDRPGLAEDPSSLRSCLQSELMLRESQEGTGDRRVWWQCGDGCGGLGPGAGRMQGWEAGNLLTLEPSWPRCPGRS